MLAVLLAQPQRWRHGYGLAKDTGLGSATLYPLLMRLHDQGLLDSAWHEPEERGRPPRHVYRLTAGGLALAREAVARGAAGWRLPPKPLSAGAL